MAVTINCQEFLISGAGHLVKAGVAAFMNQRQPGQPEHLIRVVARALQDENGAYLQVHQPCITGWKIQDSRAIYDIAYLAEQGAISTPITYEHGVAYLEVYPTPRDPIEGYLELQSALRHLSGSSTTSKQVVELVAEYHRQKWEADLRNAGYAGEIPQAERLRYLANEKRVPRVRVAA